MVLDELISVVVKNIFHCDTVSTLFAYTKAAVVKHVLGTDR